MGVYTRTSGYYAQSWLRYLSGEDPDGLPKVRPTVGLAGHALTDEVALSTFRLLRPTRQAELAEREAREVRDAVELYEASGWINNPAAFLAAPPPLTSIDERRVTSRRRDYTEIRFDSEYEPSSQEPGRDRWLDYESNREVRAWMLRHDEARPWIVCVHGTGMGRASVDLTVFRARVLHETYGLNVLMPVLPLHGPRGRDVGKGVGFPGEDVMDNVHGTAQAVWDVRRAISWIRSSQGADTPIGISSISLGGYVSALVGSLEDDLTCVILGVPVADLGDLLDRHAGPVPTAEQWHTVELARQLGTVVSPFGLTPRVPFEGRFIYAGLADRLVHPREQVARLWEHWGRPEIEWYRGGHGGFIRSRPVQDFTEAALVQSGLIRPA